jgi:hypothetical protein
MTRVVKRKLELKRGEQMLLRVNGLLHRHAVGPYSCKTLLFLQCPHVTARNEFLNPPRLLPITTLFPPLSPASLWVPSYPPVPLILSILTNPTPPGPGEIHAQTCPKLLCHLHTLSCSRLVEKSPVRIRITWRTETLDGITGLRGQPVMYAPGSKVFVGLTSSRHDPKPLLPIVPRAPRSPQSSAIDPFMKRSPRDKVPNLHICTASFVSSSKSSCDIWLLVRHIREKRAAEDRRGGRGAGGAGGQWSVENITE